jgi:hypothetical protein
LRKHLAVLTCKIQIYHNPCRFSLSLHLQMLFGGPT